MNAGAGRVTAAGSREGAESAADGALPPGRRLAPLKRAGSSPLEAAGAGVLLLGLAFSVFGPHIASAGFSFDDWTLGADYRQFAGHGGFVHAASRFMRGATDLSPTQSARPLEGIYYATTYGLFGLNASLHHVWVIFLAGSKATLFYLLLRALAIERLHALAISTLVLLFPAADANTLWVTAGVTHFSLSLYLAGALLALAGLRAARRRTLFHAGAGALYAASLLTYEIAAGGILLSVLLYKLSGATWRSSLRRWTVDLAIAGVCLAYISGHVNRHVHGLSDAYKHARTIGHEALELIGSAGLQGGAELIPIWAALLVVLAAAVLSRRLPADDSLRQNLRRWLAVALAGGVALGAGYILFPATDFYYTPLARGIGNRTNAAASLGFGVLLYSLVMLVGLISQRVWVRLRTTAPARRRLPAAVAIAMAAFVVTWTVRLESDASDYDRSSTLQSHALGTARSVISRPPPGSMIYLFQVPGRAAPGVFVFVNSDDLSAALRLRWHDTTLRGVPAASIRSDWPGNRHSGRWGIACKHRRLYPRGVFYKPRDGSSYGKTIFVDVGARTGTLIRNRRQCEQATAKLIPEQARAWTGLGARPASGLKLRPAG